jgi:hypothetical protein
MSRLLSEWALLGVAKDARRDPTAKLLVAKNANKGRIDRRFAQPVTSKSGRPETKARFLHSKP